MAWDQVVWLSSPYDVALDSADNLYIADRVNHRIRRVSAADGFISTVAGDGIGSYNGEGVATAVHINNPNGLAIDGADNLYFSDNRNHRIRKVDVGGIISTVAGNGTLGFSGDGAGAALAQLNSPTAVAIDSAGNLYISDRNNHRIRKVAGIAAFLDIVAPVVTAPADIIVSATSPTGIAVSDAVVAAFLAAGTATDNVGVVGGVTTSTVMGTALPANFPVGVSTVQFNAVDAAGNAGLATATVRVLVSAASAGFIASLPLADINGSGVPDLAVLGKRTDTGQYVVRVKDPNLLPHLIVEISLNNAYLPVQILKVPDLNANGVADIAVLEVDPATGKSVQIQVKDGLTGALIVNIPVNPNYKPHKLVVLGDVNGNGSSELALSEVDAVTGNNVQIQVKDALTGALIVNIPVNTSKKPHQLVALGDANGSGTPDLALSEVDAVTGNNAQIQVKDGGTGALIVNIPVNTNKKPHQLVVVADTNANGSAELALSEVDPVTGNNAQIQVKDSGTGALIVNIPVNPNYAPLSLASVPDSNGNGVEELGLLERDGAGNVQVQIKDALTGGLITNLKYPKL